MKLILFAAVLISLLSIAVCLPPLPSGGDDKDKDKAADAAKSQPGKAGEAVVGKWALALEDYKGAESKEGEPPILGFKKGDCFKMLTKPGSNGWVKVEPPKGAVKEAMVPGTMIEEKDACPGKEAPPAAGGAASKDGTPSIEVLKKMWKLESELFKLVSENTKKGGNSTATPTEHKTTPATTEPKKDGEVKKDAEVKKKKEEEK
eukprot:GFYU01006390.1.p1 GENE.GFYU01006390.1~~GFYU01006390.1.p1  ORF type:complete len:204 (-),score=95.52 GFYU01006390.1:22-633(-)